MTTNCITSFPSICPNSILCLSRFRKGTMQTLLSLLGLKATLLSLEEDAAPISESLTLLFRGNMRQLHGLVMIITSRIVSRSLGLLSGPLRLRLRLKFNIKKGFRSTMLSLLYKLSRKRFKKKGKPKGPVKKCLLLSPSEKKRKDALKPMNQ